MPVDPYKITLLVVAGVMTVVFAWLLRPSAVVRPNALRDTARRAGLAITPEVEPVLIARIRSRNRGTLIGTLIALIVATASLVALPDSLDGGIWSALMIIVLTGLGGAVGLCVAEFRSAHVSLGDRPRVARSPTPSRGDYLSTVDLWCAPVAVAVSGVAMAAVAVLILADPDNVFRDASIPSLWWPGFLLWIVSLTSIGVGRILSTRLVGRGQPAGSDMELAWSDALRSWTLRALVQTPALGAFCSAVVVMTSLSTAVVTRQSGIATAVSLTSSVVLLVMSLGLAGASVFAMESRRPPHYLSRLWPDVAAELRRGAYGVAAPVESGRP
ncbi:hypothetical protein [Cryobacterium arcticum]|uniref:Uncharacterized protein n=1 Tax=Cryobacterium arcticum TaxID=670052 RepID=A0A1B1BEZ6_9MICO|nr:hypothetical protein [Cryobacterium arcticum]ANP71132.1 hypothetical protein PA27867_0157 [Cryobacterium arcticum]